MRCLGIGQACLRMKNKIDSESNVEKSLTSVQSSRKNVGWCKRSCSLQTACSLITHQIPLLGEQRVTHVDFYVINISVASLLTTETFLFDDILYLGRGSRQVDVSSKRTYCRSKKQFDLISEMLQKFHKDKMLAHLWIKQSRISCWLVEMYGCLHKIHNKKIFILFKDPL